jgi:hypothetical protein
MLGKLIWENSGDELTFVPTFPDLLEYYVEQLAVKDANQFECSRSRFSPDKVTTLENNLALCAPLADRVPFEITEWSGDVIDQDFLNKLHRDWVKTGLKYPTLPLLLRSLKGLDTNYREINLNLHALESSFVFEFVNYEKDQFQVENIFGTDVIGFDQANLTLGFDNLGRSSWDKFKWFDGNAVDSDTNNYQMLSGLVELNLNRPMRQTAPPEYTAWCQEHGVGVTGASISLGNIVDLEKNLTSIRKILIRNTNEQSNKFFFEICSKG